MRFWLIGFSIFGVLTFGAWPLDLQGGWGYVLNPMTILMTAGFIWPLATTRTGLDRAVSRVSLAVVPATGVVVGMAAVYVNWLLTEEATLRESAWRIGLFATSLAAVTLSLLTAGAVRVGFEVAEWRKRRAR